MDPAAARVLAYPWPGPPPPDRPGSGNQLVDVLAYGANAAEEVLARKLGPRAADVGSAPYVLAGYDVVFSAHVSPHGAISATVVPAPGVTVSARVLRLPADLLEALDATEPNYRRERLGGIEGYVSRHGPLLLDGGPVALADVPATGRTRAALTEREVLERLRALMDPGATLEAFVLEQVRSAAVREERTRFLKTVH